MTLLTTELLKGSGVIGFLVFTFCGAVGVLWKYFTAQNDKAESFFIGEKTKLEEQLKETANRINELTKEISDIKDANIKKLEESNKKLKEANDLLIKSLRDNKG